MPDVDASIPLRAQAPQIDLGSIYSTALQLRQLKQNQQTQNTLRMLAQDPANIDSKTGDYTTNFFRKLSQADPIVSADLMAKQAEIQERRAVAAHDQSETQVADQARYGEALSTDYGLYLDMLSGGNSTPEAAHDFLKSSVKTRIDNEPWSDEKKAKIWGVIQAATPAQIGAYAQQLSMTAEQLKESREPGATKTGISAEGVPSEFNVVTQQVTPTPEGFRPDTELSLAERQRHDIATEGQGAQRLSLEQKKEALAEKLQSGSGIDAEGIQYASDIYRATGQIPSMGFGAAGTALKAQVIERAARDAKAWAVGAGEEGSGAAQDVDTHAAYRGQVAGETALGRRGALLDQAGFALDQAITQSHDAYTKLPRTEFVPFNKLEKMVADGTASPEQAAAHAADQFAINAWARGISPTGVLTVEAQKRGAEMLSGVTGPEAHDAVLNQMRKEISAERSATPEARTTLRHGGETAAGQHEATLIGPKGERVTAVYKDGRWVDKATGKPLE